MKAQPHALRNGLLLAMACAAVGYGVGALLSQRLRVDQVICWALILGFPLNLPLALMEYPPLAITFDAWLGFFYVAIGRKMPVRAAAASVTPAALKEVITRATGVGVRVPL